MGDAGLGGHVKDEVGFFAVEQVGQGGLGDAHVVENGPLVDVFEFAGG